MILILSKSNEISTFKVSEWLSCLNCNSLLITEEDKINIEITPSGEVFLIIAGEKVDINIIHSFWYWRGNFRFDNVDIPFNVNYKEVCLDFQRQNNLEYGELINFIHYQLAKKRILGNYRVANTNKLITLEYAKETGLNIPATIVTSRKEMLIAFKDNYKKIIAKPMSPGSIFTNKSLVPLALTTFLSKTSIMNVPETFSPTLFQEYIPKKYEIRTFYLDGKFFSSAIFSQHNPKTRIDYRNFNNSSSNRIIPFNLPLKIKKSIIALMKKLNLNTGSIDLIYNGEKFYFLEVNALGQFDDISTCCNYYLEREISKYLIS